MAHFTYSGTTEEQYKIAILIKRTAHVYQDMVSNYVQAMVNKGIDPKDIISFSLFYNEKDKAPAKLAKQHLASLCRQMENLKVKTILVADPIYFKILTKKRKAEPHYGYILPCALEGYEHMSVILTLNHRALFFNPQLKTKLDISLKTLIEHETGIHLNLGTGIIHSSHYPTTVPDINEVLKSLHSYPVLACDIETFDLAYTRAGIASVAFAWDQHNGIAFPVDHTVSPEVSDKIRSRLRRFFETYKGTLIYHGGTFDIKILIYVLFMQHTEDLKGMVQGLITMFKSIEDTMVITYLATNSTARNVLGLKENSFEFAGNYAHEDISDVSKIPLPELLEYNLVDTLCTWYVWNKHYPTAVADNQEQIYREIMLPSMKVVVQMELNGMPLNMNTVKDVDRELRTILYALENQLQHSPLIIQFEDILRAEAVVEKNATLKKLVKTEHDFVHVEYNPGSPKQTAKLLYDFLGFEVQDKTDTGLPATGAKTIKKLLNQLKSEHNITDEELQE